MNQNKKIALFIIILIGFIVPFIPALTIIEMFYLLIPFGIVFITTLIYLIVSLLNKNMDSRKALFVFSLLPIFILAQILSGFTVDKVQRFRSENIISEVENLKTETGVYPEKINAPLGIEYIRMRDKKSYVVFYSRGFMVKEKYQSEYNHWKSYGWND
ncbi:hypothetical protein [Mesonia phycicola]|nr:hypothetical protein [Mesonia phycicola]